VPYSAHFSLSHIMPGVDNFRYDVHLSTVFKESVSTIIFHLILKVAKAEEELGIQFDWTKELDDFSQLCRELVLEAVKIAKLGAGEIQIDYLAQVAICKLLVQEINKQFDEVISRFNNQVWEYESTEDDDLILQTLDLKKRVRDIRQNRSKILSEASREIFSQMLESQKSLQERRESNYGRKSLLKYDIFINPILHIDNQCDDYFMLENYVLLGNRIDDPDKYDTLLNLIRELLERVKIGKDREKGSEVWKNKPDTDDEISEKNGEIKNLKIDGWIRHVETVDLLLDYFQTRTKIKEIKNKLKHDENQLHYYVVMEKEQKRVFNLFYDKFRQEKLIKRIVASYEMKPIYKEYCPPLSPQQVMLYLTSNDARKSVLGHLKRLKTYYGKDVSVVNLKKTAMKIGRLKAQQRKEYFLQFLKGFFKYHRDFENFKLLKKAMDRVNLVEDERTIALSKTNSTLYEFLLPQEQVFKLDTKPVTSHVIMKADVRGATVITRQLRESGLNPASYFSLNFFNPISEIVSQYGALKVFLEGDAIILTILERKDDEAGKYCVSRACGLAINMLSIIQRYNAKSKKYKLPILELGIGICYQDAPPAYLLDGKKKIMISPAINLADRFSSCHKTLRRIIDRNGRVFNLYVYQSSIGEDVNLSDDEIILRYNVNGIELNQSGFRKLAQEIDLKTMNCLIPELQGEPIVIHTGKFPLVSGTFQRLIIREDWVQELDTVNYRPTAKVNRKYFEVCTQDTLKKYVEKQENGDRELQF